MKKALLLVFAVLVSVSFVTTVFAQAQPQAKPTEPAPSRELGPAVVGGMAKPPAAERTKDTGAPMVSKEGPGVVAGTAKVKVFKGEVVSMDAAAKKLVVKDKKGQKTFDVSMAKVIPADLKAGDKVSLYYMEKEGTLFGGDIVKAGAKLPPRSKSEAISFGVPGK